MNVSVTVVAPSSTPAADQLYIAGNLPELGNWQPGSVKLVRTNDSLWTYQFHVPRNTVVELKITRGTWNKQAIYRKGEVPDNVRWIASADTSIVIRPFSWQDSEQPAGGGIVGSVRYHRDLAGEGLNYKRDLIVWLPPSYEKEPERRYPVLYMHDGQNIIDPSTSFIGYDWHMDEVSDSLIRAKAMEEIIIVGMSNSPDRSPEYSDTPLGRSYAAFVIGVVKPLIDKTYRTKPDRENTAVMGSSMGGLISFLFTWWHPEVFSKAGCLSSAFLVDHDKILREVKEFKGGRKDIRVYLDCGTLDLEDRLRLGSETMARILTEQGYKAGRDFEYFLDEGATHNERAWAGRVWRPLIFLFGTHR